MAPVNPKGTPASRLGDVTILVELRPESYLSVMREFQRSLKEQS